jgi:hypothetical protein
MVIESWDPEEESKEQTSNKNSMRRAHTAFGGGFDSASFASFEEQLEKFQKITGEGPEVHEGQLSKFSRFGRFGACLQDPTHGDLTQGIGEN